MTQPDEETLAYVNITSGETIEAIGITSGTEGGEKT